MVVVAAAVVVAVVVVVVLVIAVVAFSFFFHHRFLCPLASRHDDSNVEFSVASRLISLSPRNGSREEYLRNEEKG